MSNPCRPCAFLVIVRCESIFFTDIFFKKASFSEIPAANGQIPLPLRAEKRRPKNKNANIFPIPAFPRKIRGLKAYTAHS